MRTRIPFSDTEILRWLILPFERWTNWVLLGTIRSFLCTINSTAAYWWISCIPGHIHSTRTLQKQTLGTVIPGINQNANTFSLEPDLWLIWQLTRSWMDCSALLCKWTRPLENISPCNQIKIPVPEPPATMMISSSILIRELNQLGTNGRSEIISPT